MTSDHNHPSRGNDIESRHEILADGAASVDRQSGGNDIDRDDIDDIDDNDIDDNVSGPHDSALNAETRRLADTPAVTTSDPVRRLAVAEHFDSEFPASASASATHGAGDAGDAHDAGGHADTSAVPHAVPPTPRLSLVTATSPEQQKRVVAELERLSLEQALLDVEVANARVIDLTSRLVEANQRSAAARAEADALRAHITSLDAANDVRRSVADAELTARQSALDAQAAHLDAQKASTAYRWAAKVWNLRNALRS